jgi:hypothetical protein
MIKPVPRINIRAVGATLAKFESIIKSSIDPYEMTRNSK